MNTQKNLGVSKLSWWRIRSNSQCLPWKDEAAKAPRQDPTPELAWFCLTLSTSLAQISFFLFCSTCAGAGEKKNGEKKMMQKKLHNKPERGQGRFRRGGFPGHCLLCVVLIISLCPQGPLPRVKRQQPPGAQPWEQLPLALGKERALLKHL